MNQLKIKNVNEFQLKYLLNQRGLEGEVVYARDSGRMFCFYNDHWTQISDAHNSSDAILNKPIPMICENCGAPLIYNHYSKTAKCEYCDTEYLIKR